MTRALAIALLVFATLGAIAAAFLTFVPSESRRRPPPGPWREERGESHKGRGSASVRVLAGETPGFAVVLKERCADRARAGFTDRALAEALGAPGDTRFVEIWLVTRGDPSIEPAAAPVIRRPDGTIGELRSLEALLGGRTPDPRARMLIASLGPISKEPVRKGVFRRTVYALPPGTRFEDVASAEVPGVRLEPRETTEAALDSWFERPGPDLLAALDQDARATSRSLASTEDSR